MTSMASGSQQTFLFNNAKTAYLVGAEIEVRKNFGFASKKLEDLVFVANMAYIYSRVDLRNVKNNKAVYLKVIGKLPKIATEKEVCIKISDSAAQKLGTDNVKFLVEIEY